MSIPVKITKKGFIKYAVASGLSYGGSVWDKTLDDARRTIDYNIANGFQHRENVDKCIKTSNGIARLKIDNGDKRWSYLDINGKSCVVYVYRDVYIIHWQYTEASSTKSNTVFYT